MTPAEDTCPFCAIARGEADGTVVFKDEFVAAFLDKRPLFPGHLLVVPVVHIETLGDLPDELVLPLMRVVRASSRAMESLLHAEGSFVAQNNRVSQSVPHLHVHVVPRSRHDGLRGFFWPRTGYESDEQRERIAETLRQGIAEELAGD